MLKNQTIIPNAKCIVTAIGGDDVFRSFILGHNLSVGTVFTINYSPKYAQLVCITFRHKILSIRKKDFEQIEWVRIA